MSAVWSERVVASNRRPPVDLSDARIARVPALIALLVLVGSASSMLVARPTLVLAGLFGSIVLVAMVLNIRLAVLSYVGAEPFAGYLTHLSGSAIKLVGAIMFLAWVVRLLRDRRPAQLRHVAILGAAALFLALIASLTLHTNGSVGVVTTVRYLSYIGALVVLADTMRSGRSGLAVRTVVGSFTLSCAAAAAAGLISFVITGGGRAAGPMNDPNDFAFYLICALPFALLLSRGTGRWRYLFMSCSVVLLVTTLATFSRGAVVGLGVMLIVAILLRLITTRLLVAGVVSLLAIVGVVYVVSPALITKSFQQKAYVAGANVNDRYASWTVAGEMLVDNPVLGRGPGGFQVDSSAYSSGIADDTHLDVAHEMYLGVGSDLGLLGLSAFLTVLVGGVLGAVRALRNPKSRPIAAAVCVSFAGTLTAAIFLSEQYYLPVWLLAACGAALDPWTRRGAGR